jgi:hypothetical protein
MTQIASDASPKRRLLMSVMACFQQFHRITPEAGPEELVQLSGHGQIVPFPKPAFEISSISQGKLFK